MNATLLYTKLSLEVLNVNSECSDENLNDFMKNDRGFYKLRSLLICRACRELSIEPYSSSFCQHLVCKQCLEEKKTRNPGCKWCRNEEDLEEDVQSKILIGLYKQLCAILKDVVTAGTDADMPGTSSTAREKLLRFLNEGCSLPDFVFQEPPKVEEVVTEKSPVNRKNRRGRKSKNQNTTLALCPPCCCKCGENGKSNDDSKNLDKSDISNDPVKITAAQSSEECIKDVHKSPEYTSDNVSSTVPDSVTAENPKIPSEQNHNNKDGGRSKIVNRSNKSKRESTKKQKGKDLKNHKVELEPLSRSPSKIYETINSLSKKRKNNVSIYEKYGLALSPSTSSDSKALDVSKDPSYTEQLKRKKLHPKEKKKKQQPDQVKIKDEEPIKKQSLKIQPLKLTVHKINNQNNNISYKIQYNSTTDSESNNNISNDCKSEDDDEDNLVIDLADDVDAVGRKTKRKATFVTNYALFSDESDFEPDQFKNRKRPKKPAAPKETRDACGCGAGSNVKFFTDICKRSRCPCFSQGRACMNCKCRFCSNPYLLEDEVICSDDSDSSQEIEPLVSRNNEVEDVDVEIM